MRRLVHDSKTHTVFCLPLPCPAPPGPPGFTLEMAHLGRPPALLCLLPATLQPEAQPETPFSSRQRRKPEASAQPSCQEFWIIHDMATDLLVSSTWLEFLFTGASQSSLCLHSCYFFPGWVIDSQLHVYALSYLHRWREKYIIFLIFIYF